MFGKRVICAGCGQKISSNKEFCVRCGVLVEPQIVIPKGNKWVVFTVILGGLLLFSAGSYYGYKKLILKPAPLITPRIVPESAPPVAQVPTPQEPAPIKAPVVEEKPTEAEVEEVAPPVKAPSLVMEKIDTDGDGIPDTFVIKGEPGAAPTPAKRVVEKKEVTTGKININTSTLAELQAVKGIGEILSRVIMAYRINHGAFKSIEELKMFIGVTNYKFDGFKDEITVGDGTTVATDPVFLATYKKININKASYHELRTIPNIGDSYAKSIIRRREMIGPFKKLEEVKEIFALMRKKNFNSTRDFMTLANHE